jgi:hypothetical protein
MAIIAGPSGSIARGGPLTTIAPQYIPTTEAAADPGAFDNLLNFLRKGAGSVDDAMKGAGASVSKAVADAGGGRAVAGKIAGKYLPIAGAGLSVLQGDVGGALGGLGGMAVGSLLGPVGALGGSVVGGMLGTAAQKGIGGLVQGALGGAAANTAARGESAGPIPGLPGIGAKEVGGMDANRMLELVRAANTGRVEAAQALNPMLNQNLDQQRNRQMQLNQQTAQLTGGLNQQRYMAELAGGAQSETGALTRQIMTTTNPYANSAFQYR